MLAPEPFRAGVGATEPVVIVAVAGEVDAATVGGLTDALDEAIRAHDRHVVIDAVEVSFIDSTGITAMVAGMRRLNRTRRRLAVACPADSPLGRALAVSGLDRTLEVHGTVGAATEALSSAPLLGR
jgi:anti-sigma B factor antagonist